MGHQTDGSKVERFEAQILLHLPDLYRSALRLTGQPADAEDLVQETCLRAFQALDQLRHPRAAKVWVFTILRSAFLRHAERQPPRSSMSLDDLEAAFLTSHALRDAEDGLSPARHALLQEIRQATLGLPLPYREAIALAHVGGFSYREMARILGVPVGTVMSRLFRARRLLRASLRDSPATRSQREARR